MTNSCQVDFYVLENEARSPDQLACRLAMMAWEQGHRIAVLTESAQDAARLDKLMWEFPANRFLPHALAGADSKAPVTIGTQELLQTDVGDVVINLTRNAVTETGRFSRLLEIVPASAHERAASRIKFREYRDRGLEPVSHPIA
jgi:DNA polymerase-3 subunit chi